MSCILAHMKLARFSHRGWKRGRTAWERTAWLSLCYLMTERELVIVAIDNRRSRVETPWKHETLTRRSPRYTKPIRFPRARLKRLYELVANSRAVPTARFYWEILKIIFFSDAQKLIPDFSQKISIPAREFATNPHSARARWVMDAWRWKNVINCIANCFGSLVTRLLRDFNLDVLIKLSSAFVARFYAPLQRARSEIN